jgi:hypothetical protein
MLPHTIRHYRTCFPDCVITIFDNYSTDKSCEIAEKHGCHIRKYESGDKQDEKYLMWVRSHLWKEFVTEGWVIMCDMDEWLDITDAELEEEDSKGTTILMTQGFNMVGESQTADYSDISLFDLKRGYYDDNLSKRICFKHPTVAIEFWWGAHKCFPHGEIHYSEKTYFLKHYNAIGEAYLISKLQNRYLRNLENVMNGINGHYTNDVDKIKGEYRRFVGMSVDYPMGRYNL